MTNATSPAPVALTDDQVKQRLAAVSQAFKVQMRSPILHTPAEADLAFEDVTFHSEDGVPLEAWFIPREGSKKLIIVNHPRWFSRAGLPSHLEPWKSLGGMAGNDFEVNFIPDYKVLHDAGYNVLTYDLRNFGHSGTGNGGISTGGRYESRDVIGSIDFARREFGDMTTALFSRCLGCNATFFAYDRRPEKFEGIRCIVGAQPISVRVIMERIFTLTGFPMDRFEEVNREAKLVTSYALEDMSPLEAAGSMALPLFLYQVRNDLMTRESDVQSIFDRVLSDEKELFWIEGTTKRWDGYTYFARHPEKMLEWFERHMA
ncbi:alpha/beta hydrolase family protein [Sphingobium phenoxybenzoativorans]|uniref:alpha/beta hydrolase family protein n=1 Tax=Sphingobium phenoxybenzoativorans TaxID=1592790 RepID=UPI000872C06B|nr:alpha/beta hydrolase [Sphingobium phenoxybenzoativorans]